jgi:hypothetical protein
MNNRKTIQSFQAHAHPYLDSVSRPQRSPEGSKGKTRHFSRLFIQNVLRVGHLAKSVSSSSLFFFPSLLLCFFASLLLYFFSPCPLLLSVILLSFYSSFLLQTSWPARLLFFLVFRILPFYAASLQSCLFFSLCTLRFFHSIPIFPFFFCFIILLLKPFPI